MSEKPTYEELEQRIQELEQAGPERKRAEEALRQSKERYQGVVEDQTEIIYDIGGSLGICFQR